MKVCYITHYSNLYGANKSLIDSIRSLIESALLQKENILVIIPNTGAITVELKQLGINFYISPFESDWYNPKSLKAILATKRRIKKRSADKDAITKIIRDFAPDIIHSNSSVFLAGAIAAKNLQIPHIWHVREDIDNHYKRRYDDPDATYALMKTSASIIATSNYISELLRQKGIKSNVLYNIIDGKSIQTNQPERLSLIFGVVGLIHVMKNQEFIATSLIPFLKTHKDASLAFYGSGGQKIIDTILKISKSHPEIADQIVFNGYTPEIEEIYSNIDVLINLSENEAFGRVNLEANSYAIPVIGLKSGATPELIKNNITGILIDKSAKELREACTTLTDKNTRETMGTKAWNFFKEINNPRKYAEDLMDIYLNPLSKRGEE